MSYGQYLFCFFLISTNHFPLQYVKFLLAFFLNIVFCLVFFFLCTHKPKSLHSYPFLILFCSVLLSSWANCHAFWVSILIFASELMSSADLFSWDFPDKIVYFFSCPYYLLCEDSKLWISPLCNFHALPIIPVFYRSRHPVLKTSSLAPLRGVRSFAT